VQDHAGGRHRQGTIYHVRVDLTAPGGEVVVNREPGEDHTHEDLHVAIRDAFDAARRPTAGSHATSRSPDEAA
jgi:hypothetical protein